VHCVVQIYYHATTQVQSNWQHRMKEHTAHVLKPFQIVHNVAKMFPPICQFVVVHVGNSCNQDIFPFTELDQHDLQLMTLKLHTKNSTITSIQKQLLKTNQLNDNWFNNDFDITEKDTQLTTDLDIDLKSMLPINNDQNKYIHDFTTLDKTKDLSGFSILNFNIRSLKSNYHNFCDTLLSTKGIQPDIIALTETWTDNNTNINDYYITGYQPPFLQNRNTGRGGGVMLYFRDHIINPTVRKDFSFTDASNNCLTIRFTTGERKKKVLVTCTYRSPSPYNTTFQENFEKVTNSIQKQNVDSIIVGDFNYNLFNINTNQETNQYYETLISQGYQPKVTKATRVTETTCTLIDHIWTNKNCTDDRKNKTYIVITDITDHLPILYVDKYFAGQSNQHKGYTYVKRRQINDHNTVKFITDLCSKESEFNDIVDDANLPVNEAFTKFMNSYADTYNHCFPIKNKKIHNKTMAKPWITPDILRAINKKNKLFGIKTKTGNEKDKEKYRCYKKEVEKMITESKENYFTNKLYHKSKTLKQKWDTIRELINRQTKNNNTCPINSTKLGNHYANVAKNLCKKLPHIELDEINQSSLMFKQNTKNIGSAESFQFQQIQLEDIETQIDDLDGSKGPGPDSIATNILKQSSMVISPYLTTLCNKMIDEGKYPDCLKTAKCVPIFKGGNLAKDEPVNYRPISILNALNKVIEKILHKQLSFYLENNDILPTFQYGYRKNRNCQQAVTDLTNYIERATKDNLYTIAIYMDLSKAFDTVDKKLLYDKLDSIGIGKKANNLIFNYMSNRKICFSNDKKTYNMTSGVPQGSVLGPLLFLTYIADMKYLCPDIKKIVYADDTTVIVTGKSKKEATRKANETLDRIYNYYTYNRLTINSTKTNYMTFCKQKQKLKKEENCQLVLNGTVLEEIQTTKFLGMIMNNRLTWENHKSYIKTKIAKSIGILYNSRAYLKHNDILTMYRTFVEPFYLYCITVWGHSINSETDELIKLQNKTLRILFSCYRTEDAWRYTNNKILPLKQLYKHEVAKFCYKHQNNMLPNTFVEDNMPNKQNDYLATQQYHLRDTHNNRYTHERHTTTIITKFTQIWNDLPDDIREIPYSTDTRYTNYFNNFNRLSKRHFLQSD
jgi:hypothetical protein